MSNIVWSADKGWHDGPGATVTVDDRGRIRAVPVPDKHVGTNCACGVPGCSGSAA